MLSSQYDSNTLSGITWNEIIPLAELEYNLYNKRGIYIWGFSISNRFHPYYVGIAENIALRIYEHTNAIISGKYTVYHKDELAQFFSHNGKTTVQPLYRPDWPAGYNNFLQDRKDLGLHIDFMIENFCFSCAFIPDASNLKELEKFCINKIGLSKLGNTRAGTSSISDLVMEGCERVVNCFNPATS